MPGYDVMNGLASAAPLLWLTGFAIVLLVGVIIGRRKR